MKNRNIPYYVAALMLAAGVSTSFVSCVDTEEPESIAELRKAKAEEVRAEAKVQEALAGLKDAEAAYKKAEERAKIAEAVTTELANELTKATNAVTIAIKESTLDLEKQTAVVKAQATLDEEKKKAAVALADYERAIKEAQVKAQVALQELAVDGVAADYRNKSLATLLSEYNTKLDAVAEKTLALKKAIANEDAKTTNERTLKATVKAKEVILANDKKAKADFEKIAADEEITAWVAKYVELDKTIKAAEPTQRQLEYEGTELANQKEALDKKNPGSADYEKEKQEAAKVEFEVPEVLQEAFASYDDDYFSYNTEKKKLVAKEDIENGQFEKSVEKILKQLNTDYLNEIKKAYDKETLKDLEKTYTDLLKTTETNTDSWYKKWDEKVKAYQADHSKAGELESATSDYIGVAKVGESLLLVKPTWENLLAYYGGDENAAKNIWNLTTAPLGQLNNAKKAWTEAKLADGAATLENTIKEAVQVVTDEIAKLKKAKEDMEASEEYKTLLEKIAKNTEDQAAVNTDAETKLQGIIKAFALKYAAITFSTTDGSATATEKSFSLLAQYDDAAFKEDLEKARAYYDEKIANDEADVATAKAKLEKFQKAVETNDFSGYFNDAAETYAKAIVLAQEALDKAQKEADEAKAKYDEEVSFYKNIK
jgi:hypothetical protein